MSIEEKKKHLHNKMHAIGSFKGGTSGRSRRTGGEGDGESKENGDSSKPPLSKPPKSLGAIGKSSSAAKLLGAISGSPSKLALTINKLKMGAVFKQPRRPCSTRFI